MSGSYLGELVQLADRILELDQLEASVKGTRDWKLAKAEYDASKQQFEKVSDHYIDALLANDEWREKATDEVEASIAEFRGQGDPSWHPAIEYVEQNFLPKLRKEAAKSPKLRKALKKAPWVLGAIGAVIYFGIRFASGTPVTSAIDSREGIEQRAAAIEKVIRYDDWMDTRVRRGGMFKGILFWPIEPSQSEVNGAAEFAGLVIEGQGYATGCGAVVGAGDGLSDAQIAMIGEVAEYIRSESTVWQDPPVQTVLAGLEQASKC